MAREHHSPLSCLNDIGITDPSGFLSCTALTEEFAIIKKTAKTLFLTTHPDKGGDPSAFRSAHAAFQVLKSLFHENRVLNGSYVNYFDLEQSGGTAADGGSDDLDDLYSHFANSEGVPSYEHFAEAAREEVPGYRVELARSGRAACVVCKKAKIQNPIAKGEVRVGSLDDNSGSYGRWHHLACWRVPKNIKSGFTDPDDAVVTLRDLKSMEEVLLSGVSELDANAQTNLLQHVMERSNWAGSRKRKPKTEDDTTEDVKPKAASKKRKATKAAGVPQLAAEPAPPAPTVPARPVFVLLNPAEFRAADKTLLKGKTFVISGYFPEVGGGEGETVGVEIVKEMITSFGGKVIKTLGKTVEFLILGKDPSRRTFNSASKKDVKPINLYILRQMLMGQFTLDGIKNLPTLSVDSFMQQFYQPGGAVDSSKPTASTAAAARLSETKPAAKKASAKKTTTKATGKSKTAAAAVVAASVARAAMPSAASVNPASYASMPAAASTYNPNNYSGRVAVPHTAASAQMVPRANPSSATASTSMVPSRGGKARFQIPRPGVDGAIPNVFAGKRFVLTGIFPEVGGGGGLNLGKDKMKKMIESFGGKVTGSVSGKTDFVVIGKEPGESKVGQARYRDLPLLDLLSLRRLLLGQQQLEDVRNQPPPRITNFSAGYQGNRIAYY